MTHGTSDRLQWQQQELHRISPTACGGMCCFAMPERAMSYAEMAGHYAGHVNVYQLAYLQAQYVVAEARRRRMQPSMN